jgi:hypothetical protein
MQNERKIHLVSGPEPQFLRSEVRDTARIKRRKKLRTVGAQDIVRETLAIAWECREVLAVHPISKDQLLVELVASLALARIRKAGAR